MIALLARHTWLLLTYRHNLRGLETRSTALVVSIALVSCAVALSRWGVDRLDVVGLHGMLILAIAAFLSVRGGIAYALVSIGVDSTAMAVALAWIEPHGDALAAWELSAVLVAANKAYMARAPS